MKEIYNAFSWYVKSNIADGPRCRRVQGVGGSAVRLFAGALAQVQEFAAAYADASEPPRPVEPRAAYRGRHSLAARAARAVSDAGAGIASVLIVADSERAEAERLVGAHCASVKDKDPLAPVVVNGRRQPPVIVAASGAEAAEFFATYGRVKRGR